MVKTIDILALKFINKNINSDNVLMILQHLTFLHQKESVTDPPLDFLDRINGTVGDQQSLKQSSSDKERYYKSIAIFLRISSPS